MHEKISLTEAEYEGLLETLALQSSPGFRKGFEKARAEAKAGDTLSFDAVFGEAQ